jgi:hypothetical protein
MAKKVQTVEMDGITFEVIGIFDYEGQDYLALARGEEIYLYVYIAHNDGTFEALDIEDEDLFNAVAEEFTCIQNNQVWEY